MPKFIVFYIHLLRLKASPADAPYMPEWLVPLVLVDLALAGAMAGLIDQSIPEFVLVQAGVIAVSAIWCYALLSRGHHQARAVQLFVALLGVHVILQAVMLWPTHIFMLDYLQIVDIIQTLGMDNMQGLSSVEQEAVMQQFTQQAQPYLLPVMLTGVIIIVGTVWWAAVATRILRMTMELQ